MSDRTMLNIGKNTLSVPKPAKRALQVVVAVALTCLVTLLIMVGNSFLLSRGSSLQGFDIWYAFIKRPDIIGTMALTAMVTVAYLFWQKDGQKR